MEKEINYLFDTNIWLEILLDQENADTSISLFQVIQQHNIFVSDFSLQSIGIITSKLKKYNVFKSFLQEMFINSKIKIITLSISELFDVIDTIEKYSLDYDDAYQFVVTKKYNLELVTYDNDFRKKGLNCYSPKELIS